MNSSPLRQTLTSQPAQAEASNDPSAVTCQRPRARTAAQTWLFPLSLFCTLTMPAVSLAQGYQPISLLQSDPSLNIHSVFRHPVRLSQATCPTSSQTQKRRVALLWTAETTLTLLNCEGEALVRYNSLFQDRRYTGGPITITGNGRWKLGSAPPVDVTISDFTRTESSVGFHIKVNVLKAGSHTIFDGYLGG